MKSINNYLDDKGRVMQWPARQSMKCEVVEYIASKFELSVVYTEKEVNQIINEWHTFGDYFMLRRGMIEIGAFTRTKNGAEYRKNPNHIKL